MRRLVVLAVCGVVVCAASAQAKTLLGAHGDLPRFQELTGQRSTVHQAFLAWGQGRSFGAPFVNLFSRLAPVPMLNLGTAMQPPGRCEAVTPAGIAAGKGDGYLKALTAAIAEWGRAIYIRPLAEMNNAANCYAGFSAAGAPRPGHSPASYRLAFVRIYLILHGGRAAPINAILRVHGLPPISSDLPRNPFPRLRIMWSPLASGSPHTAANAPAAYYPGGRFVDVDGADIIDETAGDTAPWRALETLYAASRRHRKPFAVPEWGLTPDDPLFVAHMCHFLRSHVVEELGFDSSRPGSPYDLAPKPRSRAAYRQCITPMGAPLPGWASVGGGRAAPTLSLAFVVAGDAKTSSDAPGGANELEVNFDPHTRVIGSAFWLRDSPLGKVTPLPPRATGFVLATKGGSSPTPLAPPGGATAIHIEWDPLSDKLVKASWYRVGTLLADIPLAGGQTAIAVGGLR